MEVAGMDFLLKAFCFLMAAVAVLLSGYVIIYPELDNASTILIISMSLMTSALVIKHAIDKKRKDQK